METEKTNQERVEKLAEHIARQVYDLSLDYLPKIEKAGSESEKGEAKVSFAIAWPAYHHSPSVITKLSFSSSTKDETESRIDLEQQGFNFGSEEEEEPEARAAAKPETKQLPYDVDAVIDATTDDGSEVKDFDIFFKAFDLMDQAGRTSCSEISKDLGLSYSDANDVFYELLTRGLIDKNGVRIGGEWTLAGDSLPDPETSVSIIASGGNVYQGAINLDEERDEEVFVTDDGAQIELQAIEAWRHSEASEEATVEDFQDDPDEDADIYEDYVFTRYASTNHGRDESGKATASSTAGEQQAAAAVIAKLHPDAELLRLDEAKHMPKRVFKGDVEWNVWSYAVRVTETA